VRLVRFSDNLLLILYWQKLKTRDKVSNSAYEHRKATVLALDHMITDYDFDKKSEEWCRVTVKVSTWILFLLIGGNKCLKHFYLQNLDATVQREIECVIHYSNGSSEVCYTSSS